MPLIAADSGTWRRSGSTPTAATTRPRFCTSWKSRRSPWCGNWPSGGGRASRTIFELNVSGLLPMEKGIVDRGMETGLLATPRLLLIPATADTLGQALDLRPDVLGRSLNAHVPVDWPPLLDDN